MRRWAALVLWLSGALLAACVDTGASLPEGNGAVVSWGNSGSLFGTGKTTVSPDDSVLITWTRGNGETGEVRRQGPPGTFGQIDRLARRQLYGLAPSGGPACPDYGVDYIERRDGHGAVTRAEARCPDPDLDEGLAALGDALSALLDAGGT